MISFQSCVTIIGIVWYIAAQKGDKSSKLFKNLKNVVFFGIIEGMEKNPKISKPCSLWSNSKMATMVNIYWKIFFKKLF